jgi:Ni,Fe-hydrogenase III small subunit
MGNKTVRKVVILVVVGLVTHFFRKQLQDYLEEVTTPR